MMIEIAIKLWKPLLPFQGDGKEQWPSGMATVVVKAGPGQIIIIIIIIIIINHHINIISSSSAPSKN